MSTPITFVLACLVSILAAAAPAPEPALHTGDVVFHTSRSRESEAIQRATASPYSHTGLVEVTPEGTFVIEAVEPVQRIPWARWRRRSVDGRVLVRRVPGLDESRAVAVVAVAKGFVGRHYDAAFKWDDGRIYCSELVRKAYERGAGLTLGELQPISSLRLSGLEKVMIARWGPKIPLERRLVTPASLAADAQLTTVFSTY